MSVIRYRKKYNRCTYYQDRHGKYPRPNPHHTNPRSVPGCGTVMAIFIGPSPLGSPLLYQLLGE
jgi:hypothetical protein